MGEAEVRVAAEAAVRLAFRAGDAALVEDGEPADGLFVVESGAMELVHADRVVDVLEPGECFGQLSLLTGMAPAFTVRAREDATCLVIPREPALRVLGQPGGVGYLAGSLRERLVRTGRAVHALPELSLARVGQLVEGPPLVLGLDTPLRDAARAMTDAGVT
ncbi:MAG: cyclic nucleotide-binding domain-containing protein, partial [Actinomycetota bacterium]|nr:cyclic nucleotide-binding domain-containing protein [Actinomycetota bacterium]